jgi:hypothetical protein
MIAWSTTAKYEILLSNSVLALATRPMRAAFGLLSRTDSGCPLNPLAVPAAVLASPPTARDCLRILKDCAVQIPSAIAKALTDPVPVFRF